MNLFGFQINELTILWEQYRWIIALLIAICIIIFIIRHYNYKTAKLPFEAFDKFSITQKETLESFSKWQNSILESIKSDFSWHHTYTVDKISKIETSLWVLSTKKDKNE